MTPIFSIVKVNAKYEGKTAVHAAAEEGRIDVLKVLFEFRADLELAVSTHNTFVYIKYYMVIYHRQYLFHNQDGEGERPLHRCAYL